MSVAQIFAWVYFVCLCPHYWQSFFVPTSARVSGCVVSDVLCGSPSLDFCYSIWKSKKLLTLGCWWIFLVLILAVFISFVVGWDWYIPCSEGCLLKTSQNRIHMQSFKDKAPHLVVCLILSDLTCCTVAPLHQALRAAAQLACACHSQTSLIPSTWAAQSHGSHIVLTNSPQSVKHDMRDFCATNAQNKFCCCCCCCGYCCCSSSFSSSSSSSSPSSSSSSSFASSSWHKPLNLSHIALRMPSWIATPRWRSSTEGRGTEMHRVFFWFFGSAVN